MKRRQFIAGTLAGTAGMLAGSRGSLLAMAATESSDGYRMGDVVPLGRTGLKLSRVGLGTGMHGWNQESDQTRLGTEGFNALVRDAWDRGIRWFDAADLYGSHRFLQAALSSHPRADYVLSSKIWFRPNGLLSSERPGPTACVERFLRELQTDYLDLVLLHCVVSGNWPTEQSDYMEELDALKKRGLIRAHGLSCHTLEALTAATKEDWVDSVNTRINPFAVKMDVKDPAEVGKVVDQLKALHAQGKGVVGMKIIGEGEFSQDSEKIDQSIAFALNLGCVDVMTVGFCSGAQIEDFRTRMEKVPVVRQQA